MRERLNYLTNEPNKTPKEKQALADKKKELERLNKANQPNSEPRNDKNSWIKPALIIDGSVLVTGVIIYLFIPNNLLRTKSKRLKS